MVNISVRYDGGLHCNATHEPSQSEISTDAPVDNKGKGESFSPTDLVATALGTCISTTMGIKAETLGVDLKGMRVFVQKEMSADAPRRIVSLPSEVHIPLPADSPHREVLEQTALNCPVHKSLPGNQPTDQVFLGGLMRIRKAVEADVPNLLPLMRKLARFERYDDAFAITEEILREQGFRRSPPDFECFVAEEDLKLIGLLVYYFVPFTVPGKAEHSNERIICGRRLSQQRRGRTLNASSCEGGRAHWLRYDQMVGRKME